MNINDVITSHLCYGCGTCNVICGRDAIHMEYDNIGRLLPVVDKENCVDCGLCRQNCPSLDIKGIQIPDTEDIFIGNVEKVYIGRANDLNIFKNAQSGGLVTATIKYLFESGKIDAAIMCKVDLSIEYTPIAYVVRSIEELANCQKSSYVPIDIVSAIKQTEGLNSVAVVGTACHIQGIKSLRFFNKKYRDKIKYTIGLICDRTLCKTITDVLYGDIYRERKKKIIWRDKSKRYSTAQLLIQTEDGKTKKLPRWQRFVLKDPFTNTRCRICFDKLNTNADIVYGDPWGMSNVDWKNGDSVIIVRTQTGEEVVNNLISNKIISMKDASLSEVISGQQIETRKREVSSAVSFYQQRGWAVPQYYRMLNPSAENENLSCLMSEFVEDCNLSKTAIIKKNIVLLERSAVENRKKQLKKLPMEIVKFPYVIAAIIYCKIRQLLNKRF